MSSSQRTSQNNDSEKLSYELLSATVNAAVDGIIVIGADSKVVLFSSGAERLFGYCADEVLGRNVDRLIPDLSQQCRTNYLDEFLANGNSEVVDHGWPVEAINSSGQRLLVHLSVGYVQLEEGPVFVAIARQMGEQSDALLAPEKQRQDAQHHKEQQLRQKLNQVYSSSVLFEMVSSIAHEINQPLTAITTYADVGRRLLENESARLSAIEQTLQKIAQQAIRTSEAIKKLRVLAEKSVAPRQIADVETLMFEIMDTINAEAELFGCRVLWFIEKDLPKLSVNSAQIQHVLLLLLRNSLESVAKNGSQKKEVHLRARGVDSWVEFSIQDFGDGVDSAYTDILFHPFTSSKPARLGLGLSICKTIINDHGGQIWHDAKVTEACRFLFTLPIGTQEVQDHAKS